jgi:hypothetical protein
MAKWNDPKLISSSSKYLKLHEGENKIRIVSEAGVMGKHWIEKKTIICIGKDEGCSGCETGNDPKPVWLCYVIDRTDNKIKLAEFGYTIIQQIQKLAQSEEYKFDVIPPYDITIVKTGSGLETEYTVIASRKDTPLTAEEEFEIKRLTPIEDMIKKKKQSAQEPF